MKRYENFVTSNGTNYSRNKNIKYEANSPCIASCIPVYIELDA